MQTDEHASVVTGRFVVVLLIHALNQLAFFMYLTLSRILQDAGMSPLVIAVLISATPMVRAFIGPSVGRAADRSGHRTMMVLGALLHAITCAAYVLCGDSSMMWGTMRLLHGLAFALTFCAVDGYAVTLIPRARLSRGMSIYTANAMLSSGLAAFLGEYVLDEYGAIFFQVSAFLAGLSIPLALSIQRAPIPAADAPLRDIILQRESIPVWLLNAWFPAAVYVAHLFLPVILQERGFGSIGTYHMTSMGVALAIKLGLGNIGDRIGAVKPLVVGLLVAGASMLILAAADSNIGLVAAGCVAGIGWGLVFPAMYTLTLLHTPRSTGGVSMAVATSCNFLGAFLGGLLWGLIADTHSYAGAFVAAGTLLLVSAPIFARAFRAQPPTDRGHGIQAT